MSQPVKRIVLIDDSEIILESVQLALEEIGCEVEAVSEPTRSCFDEGDPPDLILLDVNMPQAYGDDIAVFLREICGVSTPIYLYSSLDADELERRALGAGADGYICKSWGRERLISNVRNILGIPEPKPKTVTVAANALGDALSEASEQLAEDKDSKRTNVHQRFAQRCVERRDRIFSILSVEDGSDMSHAVHSIAVLLHDVVGESKLLGLDQVTTAASSLKDIVEERGGDLFFGAPKASFRRALDRFTEVAKNAALEAPEGDLWDELRTLRQNVQNDLDAMRSENIAVEGDEETVHHRRILIVDDSPIVGEVLSLELESRGHAVALASGLTEFSQQMRRFDPDLLFLDVHMPEMDGVELCKHLRQHHRTRSLPIIFLSSLPEKELEKLAERSGANGFLSKQRGMDELIKYLDELLMEIVF